MGTAYASRVTELDWYQGGEYVITNEAGYTRSPRVVLRRVPPPASGAGLRKVTLHDSRYTTLTLMKQAGVPISIISKWAGHYDSAFTQKTYVHASEEDLQRGQAALARIHKIAQGVRNCETPGPATGIQLLGHLGESGSGLRERRRARRDSNPQPSDP